MNNMKVFLMMAGLTALFGWLGAWWGGQNGMIMALGFAGHAVTDVMHRPGMLAADLAGQWYFVGSACLDALVGALCYVPLLKR